MGINVSVMELFLCVYSRVS